MTPHTNTQALANAQKLRAAAGAAKAMAKATSLRMHAAQKATTALVAQQGVKAASKKVEVLSQKAGAKWGLLSNVVKVQCSCLGWKFGLEDAI
jgi:hypothetical protein